MNIYDALDEIGSANLPGVRPGGFKIKVAEIHHGPGNQYPIGPLITEIQIFEDIERVGVTGHISLHDNVNLFQAGPIIGHELLYLQLETNGASEAGIPEFGLDFTTHPLFIYKVENMTAANEGGGPTAWLDYRLHFCSPEMLKNGRIRVSRAYQGTLDSMIESVLKEEIQTYKPILKQETLDIYHQIATNIRPYEFISQLVPMAQCNPKTNSRPKGPKGKTADTSTLFKGRQTDFLFYETSTRMDGSGGFNFVPALQKAETPNLYFTLSNSSDTQGFNVTSTQGTSYGGWVNSMLTANNYTIKFLGDKYRTISSGLWAGKLIKHNPYKKSYDIFKSDYQKQLKHKRYSLVSETYDYHSDKTITEFPDSRIKYTSSTGSKGYSNISKTNNEVNYPWNSNPDDISLLRTMQLGHVLGSHRIEFTIPGCSRLSVGELAFADLPDLGYGAGQSGLEGSTQLWENRLDNIWLVTKVAHKITVQGAGGYSTRVEVANTMSATSQVLNSYGELGSGYGVG